MFELFFFFFRCFGCFVVFCVRAIFGYLDDCHSTKGVDGVSMSVDKSGLLMYIPVPYHPCMVYLPLFTYI